MHGPQAPITNKDYALTLLANCAVCPITNGSAAVMGQTAWFARSMTAAIRCWKSSVAMLHHGIFWSSEYCSVRLHQVNTVMHEK